MDDRPTNCLYCGKNLIYSTMLRSDARFCRPEHQKEYWKLRRWMERHQKRAMDTIADLNTVVHGSTDLAFMASDMLHDIAGAASASGASLTWRCQECHQTIFTRPVPEQICDFCGHYKWSVIIPNHGLSQTQKTGD